MRYLSTRGDALSASKKTFTEILLGGLAPEKRPLIAQMGPRAVLGGSLANLMSAALVSLILTLAGS